MLTVGSRICGFSGLTSIRHRRQRFRLDVWVAPEMTEQRINAAVAAGGQIVADNESPSFHRARRSRGEPGLRLHLPRKVDRGSGSAQWTDIVTDQPPLVGSPNTVIRSTRRALAVISPYTPRLLLAILSKSDKGQEPLGQRTHPLVNRTG